MKIAVYSICLNEEQFIQRWFESAKQADQILLADTGSTDSTVEIAKSLGIDVYTLSIKPWRFDDARNASLALIDSDIDICIALDVDEVLEPGWRESLEVQWGDETRGRYKYVWSHLPDGSEGVVYYGDKVHLRNNYRWIHPVHEVITTDRMQEKQIYLKDFQITHYPDQTKSRGQYLPLLELAVQERPQDDRNSHYLAREYMYTRQFDKAIDEFRRHLSLPTATWKDERAASYRYLARCLMGLGKSDEAVDAAIESTKESPGTRETWFDLAKVCYYSERWEKCIAALDLCLSIEDRAISYISDPEAWGATPHDIYSIAAFKLGNVDLALKQAKLASDLDPSDERILNNIKFFEEARDSEIQIDGQLSQER